MKEIQDSLKQLCKELFGVDIEPELTRPEPQFGDYSTNVAMQLAAKLDNPPAGGPREIAKTIKKNFHHKSVKEIEIAGPGFINLTLTDQALAGLMDAVKNPPQKLAGQEIIVEFGDPNPFKEMHIGHLYSYIVGDSICKLLKKNGATVRRLSYHGDVGLHVAKAIYGLRELQKERQGRGKLLTDVPTDQVESFLFIAYAYGHDKYEKDEAAKAEIDAINQHIYDQDDPEINKLHETGVKLSFKYFDKILNMLSISWDKRYFESETTPVGLELVRKNVGKIFKKSQGAIVYEGEKVGLHTRVFITSQGLPTYETKDLGLAKLKANDFSGALRSIVITANEQAEYFKVMLAALAEIDGNLAKKTTHLTHGFLSLSSGKMSSRTGNVYAAKTLLDGVQAAAKNKYPDSGQVEDTYLAAVKYAFLKHRIGADIVFDVEESVSLEGNSGPYLQYAHARACSILKKPLALSSQPTAMDYGLRTMDSSERLLARKISEYPEVVAKATAELMPHHICTYLYELAQVFNGFYEKSRVIGDPREAIRLELVKSYAQVLKDGLNLLNIAAPEQI